MNRIIVFLVFLLLINNAKVEDVLQVAVYDSPPFGLVYSDGCYGGLMVEIWESIAEELNYNYEYHLEDMEGLLSGLESARYDIGLGAISITPSREERVDFTQPVNPSGTGIVEARFDENPFKSSWYLFFISLSYCFYLCYSFQEHWYGS